MTKETYFMTKETYYTTKDLHSGPSCVDLADPCVFLRQLFFLSCHISNISEGAMASL
jgi:hypothetical protein